MQHQSCPHVPRDNHFIQYVPPRREIRLHTSCAGSQRTTSNHPPEKHGPGKKHHRRFNCACARDISHPTSFDMPITALLWHHIESLPLWHRHLLCKYQQLFTDVDVRWCAFCSRKRLTSASDGSLREEAGKFGWKLTASTNKALCQGCGRVDGPIEIGSSTQSELRGFTAPLFLKMQHKCKFCLLADSKVAINESHSSPRKNHSPTKQPDNIVYPATINELFRELRQPMKIQWIKSHQDRKMTYNQLTHDAKLAECWRRQPGHKIPPQQTSKTAASTSPHTIHVDEHLDSQHTILLQTQQIHTIQRKQELPLKQQEKRQDIKSTPRKSKRSNAFTAGSVAAEGSQQSAPQMEYRRTVWDNYLTTQQHD